MEFSSDIITKPLLYSTSGTTCTVLKTSGSLLAMIPRTPFVAIGYQSYDEVYLYSYGKSTSTYSYVLLGPCLFCSVRPEEIGVDEKRLNPLACKEGSALNLHVVSSLVFVLLCLCCFAFAIASWW